MGEASASAPESARRHAAALTLVALLLASAAFLYAEGRGESFFYDEWNWILDNRGNSASAFLSPHNGHLSLFPIAIYRLLFATVGLRHYGPYRLALIALHLVVGTLVFLLLRRRAGTGVGLIGAGLILFLGRAWEDLIWPFQIGYLGSVAGGLGALLLVQRRTRRADVGAACCLAVSLASSGLGIPFTVGVVVALVLAGDVLRRAWVVVVPGALYAVWYLHYGESVASASNIPALPGYVFDSFGGAVGALTGLGPIMHRPETAVALALLAAAVVWRRPQRWVLVPAFSALAFWSLTALSRAQLHEPAASRYLYPGTIWLLLVVAEILRGFRLSRVVLVALAALAAVAAVLNLVTLRNGAEGLRSTDQIVGAELRALEIDRAYAGADLHPDPQRMPQVTAERYFRAVDALGSPALPASALGSLPPDVRADVDDVFRLVAPPRVQRARAMAGSCHRVTESAMLLPPDGIVLRSSSRIRAAFFRYGNAHAAKPTRVLPRLVRIAPRPDADPVRWGVVFGTATHVYLCAP